VEMDAGIMDGTSLLFGAVGAVSGTDPSAVIFQD
jgi:isoaspartyl peptidase/L-asparaginase-like protein (Ntn-hydrolase superfamily)